MPKKQTKEPKFYPDGVEVSCRRYASLVRNSKRNYYVLHVVGDIEPELVGPFATSKERDNKARELRLEDSNNENGIYSLTCNGKAEVGFYTFAELRKQGATDGSR